MRPQLARADEALRLLRGHRQGEHEVGAPQQLVELDLLDVGVLDRHVGVVDHHLHAEGERQLGDAPAEGAVADDADCGARKLTAHAGVRGAACLVGGIGARDAAGRIDHQADHELADGRHPAAARLRHQHAGGAGRLHVDVADVDCDPADGDEVGQGGEDGGGARRRAVGNDDAAALRRRNQIGRVERVGAFVQADVAQRAQARQRALAVVVAAHVRRVREKDPGLALISIISPMALLDPRFRGDDISRFSPAMSFADAASIAVEFGAAEGAALEEVADRIGGDLGLRGQASATWSSARPVGR